MAIDPKQQPVAATTQDFIDVVDIINGIVITRSGVFSLIVQTTSVNFELLSETEQGYKIDAYGGLINSLDFQMQILIETRKVNITNYITYLNGLDEQSRSPGLQRQFLIYKKFVSNLIVKNEILEKRFLLIIPFRSGGFFDENTPFEQKKKYLEQAINYLYPKRNHIFKQLGRIGLRGHQLTSKEVVEYMHSIYNQGDELKVEGLDLDEQK